MQQSNTQQPNTLQDKTYLTTEELAQKIKYEARTIRNTLKDSVLIVGITISSLVARTTLE